MELRFPGQDAGLPAANVPGRRLCPYTAALAEMDALTARPPEASDVLISVEHPPTITLGRRGGTDAIHGTTLRIHGVEHEVEVHEIARGGAVTYHAPGQLVVYPVVQLPRLRPPLGRGPLGDLGRYVRELEACMVATCARFGLPTLTREGFSGVWVDERTKLASIGVGVRRGWTFHGLALNVNPHLEGFDLITPCALDGVRMTTLWRELERRGAPTPSFAAVEQDLLGRLAAALVRA